MNIEQSALKLSRNPLGIIALFILLIYGLATILFGYVGTTLTENQKWWFVVFLVIFPIIVLSAFVVLVIFHHSKLYAPGDFRDEKNFFGYISPKDQAKINEGKEIMGGLNMRVINNFSSSENQSKDSLEKRVKKDAKQKIDSKSIEDSEKDDKAKDQNLLSVENMQSLIFKYYEKYFGFNIEKNVFFKVNDKKIYFDGVKEGQSYLNFYQIIYLSESFVMDERALNHVKEWINRVVSDVLDVRGEMMRNGKFPNYRYRLRILLALESSSISEKNRIEMKIRDAIEVESIPVSIRGLNIPRIKHIVDRMNDVNANVTED